MYCLIESRFAVRSRTWHTSETLAAAGDSVTGLAPFISEICGGTIPRNSLGRIEIKGYHFSPDDMVNPVIEDGSNTKPLISVSQVQFINPTLLTAVITTGNQEGLFGILVSNGNLDSETTSRASIQVVDPVWIDLRTTPILDLGIDKPQSLVIQQNGDYGLNCELKDTLDPIRNVIKFGAFRWKRCDNLRFSIVFRMNQTEGISLFGIGGNDIDVNNLGPVPLFEAESHLFVENGSANLMYGGGSRYRRWTQNIGGTASFEPSKFYRLDYGFNTPGRLMTISEVDPTDFDRIVLFVRQWFLDSPSDSEVLLPYWTTGNNPNFFLTAFKIG